MLIVKTIVSVLSAIVKCLIETSSENVKNDSCLVGKPKNACLHVRW